MPTATITISVDEERQLDALARMTGRSPALLAADALRAFLDVQDWQTEGIARALKSLEDVGGVEHSQVRSWVEGWEGEGIEPPKPNGQ